MSDKLRDALRTEIQVLRSRAAELEALLDSTAVDVEPRPVIAAAPALDVPRLLPGEREILSEREVRAMLGKAPDQPMSRSTLYDWRNKRGLPAPRGRGGSVRYLRSEIEAWMKSQPTP